MTRLVWEQGEAGLQPLGAMIDGLRLRLPDGRWVTPLATAPWADEMPAEDPALPGILRRLRGEWPCVPFGSEDETDMPARWPRPSGAVVPPHGYGSNNDWQIAQEQGRLTATIRYPEDSPIESLYRSLEPDGAGVALTLKVVARHDCSMPIALHPVLRLPDQPGAALLDVGPHGAVWSHPQGSAPDPCPLAVDRVSPSLSQMIAADGRRIDLTRLPLANAAECRVLIPAATARASLAHPAEGWQVVVEWDRRDFPGLMLWISNRGRRHSPWNGRHLAVGIEPCRAAFDLGPTVSRSKTPLTPAMSTVQEFRAGVPWETRYRIGVEPLRV